jgi:hypothetical protein
MKGSKSAKKLNEPNLGYEEKAMKYLEDVPKTFSVHLNDMKISSKKRQELLNRMFENLSNACNSNPKNG